MQFPITEPAQVISSRLYALMLSSKRLQQMLLPHGVPTSPYEILDYQVTLQLHDTDGMRATFARTQEVRFLQDGVAGVLDHAWGSGVVLTSYDNDAGTIADSFADEGRHHFVIGLRRSMGRGDRLTFRVARTTMACFATEDQWWMDTTIDHPIARLRKRIVFPKKRPCLSATIAYEGRTISLPIRRLASGKTLVQVDVGRPRADTPYVIRWDW